MQAEPASDSAIRAVNCPKCGNGLVVEGIGSRPPAHCPRCKTVLTIVTFPALWREEADPALLVGERAMEGEAVCFFHPAKRAALTCDRCGRFLCNLCDLPIGARHFCPSCLGGAIGTDKVPELVTRRMVWADAAFRAGLMPWLLSITGLMLFFFVITGPVAMFCAIRAWRAEGSLVRGKRRWLATLGFLLGLLQVSAFIAIIVAMKK